MNTLTDNDLVRLTPVRNANDYVPENHVQRAFEEDGST